MEMALEDIVKTMLPDGKTMEDVVDVFTRDRGGSMTVYGLFTDETYMTITIKPPSH